MSRITVTLYERDRQALIRYAQDQYRDPRLQAALLIRRGLEAAGYLPENAAALQAQAIEKEAGNAAANEAGIGA